MKFIVDHNVGKLAKWLRMMGFDALLFDRGDDHHMVAIALAEGRVILTRDTEIMKRRLVTSGQLEAILIESHKPEEQMRQVINALNLAAQFRTFTICLECNQPLKGQDKEEVKDRVPPYVFQTKDQYMECPACRRVYWKGTHWQAMTRRLEGFVGH